MKHLTVKTEVKDFVFTVHPITFPEPLEVLVMTQEALNKEMEPLGLKVSWSKTKVQVYGGSLDEQYSLSMRVARTLRSQKTSVAHIK